MLRLIPAPLHRALYRAAHRARIAVWQLTNPEIAGCSVIGHDLEGRVLLVRLSYGPDRWQLPGGGLNKGEAPEAGARREMREETGCEITGVTQVGELQENLLGARATTYVFAGVVEDHPKIDGREVIEARFFPVHSLPEPLSTKTRERLTLWTQKRR